jgi:hypothetical protein
LLPTKLPSGFGKISDLASSARCRALYAIHGAGSSMFM